MKGKGNRAHTLYIVYDNKTDLPIIVDGTAEQCARVMGIKVQSFYYALMRCERKECKRWSIFPTCRNVEYVKLLKRGIS